MACAVPTMTLLSAFALVAVLLVLIGIYGVTSSTVAQRTRENGVRMAMGATGGQVVIMVFRRGIQMCVIGLMIGLAVAVALRASCRG